MAFNSPWNDHKATTYTKESWQNVNPRAKITSWVYIGETPNTRVAIDVFKSLHNLLPKDLKSYFKIHHNRQTRESMPPTFSDCKCALRSENSC